MALFKPRFRADADLEPNLVVEPGTQDDPPIGADLRASGIRWDMVMSLFMRLMSAVWMLKGLMFWSIIIGLGDLPLNEETRLKQAAIVLFALIACTASVGLWLLASWGRSVWLMALAVEIGVGLFGGPRLTGLASPYSAFFIGSCYFALYFAFRKQKF